MKTSCLRLKSGHLFTTSSNIACMFVIPPLDVPDTAPGSDLARHNPFYCRRETLESTINHACGFYAILAGQQKKKSIYLIFKCDEGKA